MDSAFHRFLDKIYTAQRVKTDGISSGLTKKCDDLIEAKGAYPSQDQRLSLFMQLAKREKDLALFATKPAQKDLIATNLVRMGAALFNSASSVDRENPAPALSAAFTCFAAAIKMDVPTDTVAANIAVYTSALMEIISKMGRPWDARLAHALANESIIFLDKEEPSASLNKFAGLLFLIPFALSSQKDLVSKQLCLDLLLSTAEKWSDSLRPLSLAPDELNNLVAIVPADTMRHLDRAERIALLLAGAERAFAGEPQRYTKAVLSLAQPLKALSPLFCKGRNPMAAELRFYGTLKQTQDLLDLPQVQKSLADSTEDLTWITSKLSKMERVFLKCGIPLPAQKRHRLKDFMPPAPAGLSWLTQAVPAYRRLTCG